MRTEITAGQTSDYLGFDLVMADNLPEPSVLLADRGYDSDNIRKTMEVRDVVPVIPMRKTRKLRVAVDRRLYRLRNLVERCFNKLKNARRVATRYDKTAESFLGFIDITGPGRTSATKPIGSPCVSCALGTSAATPLHWDSPRHRFRSGTMGPEQGFHPVNRGAEIPRERNQSCKAAGMSQKLLRTSAAGSVIAARMAVIRCAACPSP